MGLKETPSLKPTRSESGTDMPCQADRLYIPIESTFHSPSQGNFSALAEFVSDHSGVVVASVFNLKFAEVAAVGLLVWSLVGMNVSKCVLSRCSTAWQEISDRRPCRHAFANFNHV